MRTTALQKYRSRTVGYRHQIHDEIEDVGHLSEIHSEVVPGVAYVSQDPPRKRKHNPVSVEKVNESQPGSGAESQARAHWSCEMPRPHEVPLNVEAPGRSDGYGT